MVSMEQNVNNQCNILPNCQLGLEHDMNDNTPSSSAYVCIVMNAV